MIWLALAALAQDSAVTLPGDFDYVLLGALDPGPAYTIEMWVRLDVLDEDTLVCNADASDVASFCLQYRSNRWILEINDDDAIEADTCTDTQPHLCLSQDLTPAPAIRHVAVTVDTTEMGLWLDGVEVMTAPTGVATDWGTRPWALGLDAEPGTPAGFNNDKLDGLVDEVRVWNQVRTAAEMDCTRAWALTGQEDGLFALWHLDAADAGVTIDATGNGHDATLMNTATLVPSPFGLTQSVGGDVGCLDFDRDGFTPDEGDCDDTDPDINPDADDPPDDGVDQDCDGDDVTTRLRGGLAECGCQTGPGGPAGLLILLSTAAGTARLRTRRASRSG